MAPPHRAKGIDFYPLGLHNIRSLTRDTDGAYVTALLRVCAAYNGTRLSSICSRIANKAFNFILVSFGQISEWDKAIHPARLFVYLANRGTVYSSQYLKFM